jgi:glycosyltransferase involved in cell wall biosynthesis
VRLVSALMFFPRGGSAHVARALAHALPVEGWDVTVVSGSQPGRGDARAFYAGLDLVPVLFGAGDAPLHPSYEDRPGAPDPVFARVDDDAYEAHVATWGRALVHARAAQADALHLHHLTPINEAAARVAPGVPVVGHLHGTELLFLERIAAGAPDGWDHAEAWAQRMREWAARCERLLVLSANQVARATALLGVDPARCVLAPNGFDPEVFRPLPVDRAALWREHLVDHPQGWRPGGEEGSVRYRADALEPLAHGAVVLTVGRFTEVKRMGLLVRAFARARAEAGTPAALVVLGGFPGEWEGEHPYDAARAAGGRGIFLAGWHDHAALPAFLNAADVIALASVREQFGLVLVEGMACGLPAIAVDRFGPAEIVEPGRTGWLVEPDDEPALARALRDAIDHPDERRRRGAAARADALGRFSWPALAAGLARVFDDVAAPQKVEGLNL